MFFPNLDCKIFKITEYDLHGEEVRGETLSERCSIIHYRIRTDGTSVRADSTASRGQAEHSEASVRLLMENTSRVEIDDELQVANHKETLQVVEKFPRYDMDGELHHWQVDLKICR